MAVAKQDSGSKKNTETKTQTVSVGGRDVSTKTTSTPKQTTQQKVTVGGRDVTVNAPKPTYTSKAQNVNSNPTVGGRQLSNRQVATDLVNQARNNTKPVEQKTQRKQEANPYKKSYTEDDYNNLKNTLYNSAEDPYYDMMWSNVEYKDMWTPEAQKEFDDYNSFMNKVGEEAQVAKGDVATQKEIKDTQGNYVIDDVVDRAKNQWRNFDDDLKTYEVELEDLVAKNQQYESLMEQLGDGEEYQKYKAQSDVMKNRIDELNGLIGDINGKKAYQNALQKRLTFEDLRANGTKDEFLEYSKYAGAYMNNVLEDIALNYEASQFRKLAGVQTFIENVKQSFGDKEAQRITDTITKLYSNGDVTEEEKDEVLAYAQNIVDRNTTKPGESIGVQLNDIANQLSMMQENGETATEKLFVDVVGNVLDNSIGQLGPAIAFGRAGMMASTALMSMSGYTQTYQQDIEAGFTHEQAQLDALFQSGVEFLSEMIGGERILRFAEGEVLPRTFGQMIVEGFKSGFAESVEEGLGWSVSPIAHYMATGEVPSIESWNPEELKQAVVTAFLAGFVQAEMSADYSQFGMEAPLSATEQTLKNFLTISTDEGKNRVQDLITELNVMGRDASWRKNIQLADGTKISEKQYIDIVKNMAELSLNEYNDKIQVKGVEIINQDRVDPIMSLAEDSKYSLKDCLEVTRQEKINSLMQSLNAGEVIQTINEQYEQDVAKKMVAQESERLAEIQKQLDKDGVKVKAPMWEQMSDEAKTNATIVSKVSDVIGGTPIEFADLRTKDGKIVDGFYDDGKIVVNPNAKLGAISTFIHEYTHGIESGRFYDQLRDEVKFLYGKDYQTLVNGIKKEYSNIKKLSQEDAERELTAKTVQKMLGNKKFVERLVKYHTDMAYKMYTDLKSMTTYSTVAESMAQTFLKAFNDNNLKQDELKRDGMYSAEFDPAEEPYDNEGAKLSKGQKEYFIGTKLVDGLGRLLRIFHTSRSVFDVFDPRGTDYYRFGDKIVNYFSTSRVVSGSYANDKYETITGEEFFKNRQKVQQEIEKLKKEAGDKFKERVELITKLQKQAETAVKESGALEAIEQIEKNINGTNIFDINSEPLLVGEKSGWNGVAKEHISMLMDNIRSESTNPISKIISINELLDLASQNKFYHFKTTQSLADIFSPIKDINTLEISRILDTYETETNRLEQERLDILNKIDELKDSLSGNDIGKMYEGYGKALNPYILENESGIINNWNSLQDSDWNMKKEMHSQIAGEINDAISELPQSDVDRLTRKHRINEFIMNNVSDETKQFFVENPIALAGYTNRIYDYTNGLKDVNKESVISFLKSDYWFRHDNDGNISFKYRIETNDVVKAVLAINDFIDNPYDGVIFRNITDSASYSAEGVESDIIALFDSDQFKLIENKNPTEDDNINFSYVADDSEYMDAVNNGDMEEAQRLVNEYARRNGYSTEQFYHATASEGFTKFDKSKIKASETDAWYNGIWVTTDPDTSPSFRNAKKTYPLYIKYGKIAPANVVNKVIKEVRSEWRNADQSNWNNESRSVQDEVRNRLESMGYGSIVFDDKVNINVDELEKSGATEWESARGRKYRLEYDEERSKEVGEDAYLLYYWSDNQGAWMWTQEDYWGTPQEIADEINTYRHGEKTVVLFEPDQIKSSQPVEYDDNGNVIPLSERFDSSNDDIRYSYDEEDGRFHTGNTTVDEMMNTIIDSMSEEEFRQFLDTGEFDYATQEEVEDDPKVQDEGLWVKDPEGDYIKIDDSYTSNGKTVAWKDERIDALIEENEKKNFAFSGHDPYQYHYAIKLSPKEYEALSYLFDPRHNRVWREEVATQPENYGTGEVTPEKLGGWAREYNDENDPRRYRYKRKIDYMFFDASFENGMLKIKEQEGNHRALILENSGYESMPILLGTDFPLRGPVTLRGMNAGDIRNPNFKELSSNDYVELVKANRDRLIEKFGSGSKADISYSFDGEEDAKKYYATIAPYLDTRLNENNRQELIDRAEKAYDGVAKEIAKSLGISPAPKTENIGGYENNEGQKLRELSWTFDLGEIDSTKARLFTSLMGDLAFENQEAVICMRYLDENEGDHKVGEEGEDGGTYGKEYGFQFNDLKTVEESLLKADIANYNIDRESNYLKVQDFGFDPNFDQKLDILLEGNNYESAEERPIYSYYLSREGRQSLYETQLKTKEGVREGNESDLSGRQVEDANRRVSDVIKNGQNSPFLRRAEAQDNERSDLEFTEKDLKNYNVIRPTTERKYSEDKNIDKETGVLSPKFITELDATVGRTTRKAEIDDAENYAEMVATQLDNGADPEDVLNQIKEEPLNNGVIRALTIGQVLADRGLYDEMHELAQWARDTDRLAGQLIESNKHLYQLDNEMSRSIYLTKVEQNLIDEYNAKFKRKSDIDIEEAVHKIFSDAFEATVKSKTVREFRDAVGALARQVNKAMPKTVWDRIRQYRMISMLSGPKTAVSNFVSNVATHGLYRMNNFNQAILEMAMKDITVRSVDDVKKFTISDDQRNTTLRKNREVSKRNKRYADKIWEQIDKGAKSKYGDDVEKIPDIIKNSKAYKTKTQYNTVGFKAKSLAGKALDLVQSVQAYMLDDSPIAKLAFRDRFNDICQARNIDVRTLDPNSKQFSSVVDSAFDYAEEVVSHNATAISKTLANIQKYSSTNVRVDKDSLTKGVDEAIKLIKERANKGESMYVLLDGTLRKMEDWFVPFYKTNASLMQKALQFSPLEWAQVKNDYDKVKAGRMDLVDMVDHMSKAVTGTTLYMLGAIFAYLGWLKWDKDDEDYSGRLAIKIPGTNIGYTADFLDPISTIFAKGVVLAQELMENGVSFTTLQKLAGDYGDIFLNDEMDMFSSMKDFFDTVGKVQKGEDDYGEYTIADGATDTAFTILNSYIPALMRDISRVIDPAKKSTYDNSNMKYLFNRLLNSTPFRTKLADKKDATGRTINYTQPFTGNDVFDRILTQMVSKGKLVDMEGKAVTTRSDNGNLGEKADEMSQMAQDFQFNDANGDGYSDTHWIRDTVPANIYPGGEQVQLNSEERDEYGKTWTDVWTSGAKSLLNNSVYKGLDYEKQADVVYELQGFARECIEADYCFEHNIELTKAQKTATAIREFCTTNGKIDGKKLGLIALGTAKENKLANGGQRYVLGKRDEDGKTITNSRQLYMRQLYEQAGIYDEIVKAVAENDNLSYQDFGLGKTVVEKYSADTAKSKYAEIYGAVMAKANGDSSSRKTSSSGAKKSSRKSSNISGGSSGIRKAGKLNKLAPVTSRSVINDKKIANGATNFMKAYASVFNRSGKKPSTGGSSGSVTCPRCGASVSANNDKCPVCGANL